MYTLSSETSFSLPSGALLCFLAKDTQQPDKWGNVIPSRL